MVLLKSNLVTATLQTDPSQYRTALDNYHCCLCAKFFLKDQFIWSQIFLSKQ